MSLPRIAFLFSGGRAAAWRERNNADRPNDFFYGAVELEQAGFSVDVIDFSDNPGSLPASLINSVAGWALPVRVRAEHVLGAIAIRKQLQDYDVIVATASYLALTLAFINRLGAKLPPVVGIHCGIANFSPSASRKRTTSRVLRNQECVFFSQAEADRTAEMFDLDPSKVHANPFGVDLDYWCPSNCVPSGGTILAVGNDARRDYETLVAAAGSWSYPVKIITRRELPSPLPPNVEWIRGSWHSPAVSDTELRDLYRSAAVVVVPVTDSIQPSGQSVALQAMACGRPVVLSKTCGLWTGDDFFDGTHLKLVPAGDSDALGDAVTEWMNNRDEAEKIGHDATLRSREVGGLGAFASRLGATCLKATAWHNGNSRVQ